MDVIIGNFLVKCTPIDILAALVGPNIHLWLMELAQRHYRATTIALVVFLGLLKLCESRLAFPLLSRPRAGYGRPSLLQRMTGFFMSSVSIHPNDRLATDVLRWHTAHVVASRGSRILSASSEHVVQSSDPEEEELEEITGLPARSAQPAIAAPWDDNANPGGVTYSPNLRNTWFIHNRRLFFLRLPQAGSMSRQSTAFRPAPPPSAEECLQILCLGWSVAPIQSLLSRCNSFSRAQTPEKIKIHMTHDGYGYWSQAYERMCRNLDTVHLDEVIKQNLMADMRRYLDPEERRFYFAQGIPYRRGYLFHGPPGTGKTSLSMALAGVFRLPLYILSLPSVGGDQALQSLLRNVESRSIVLIEDIDAMAIPEQRGREGKKGKDRQGGCTLAGLLNALDGVTSQEGRIVIMTTNHPHRLDDALKRPGRIDMEVYLGPINKAGARDMFMRMLGPDNEALPQRLHDTEGGASNDDKARAMPPLSSTMTMAAWAEVFGELVGNSGRFTPAQIQGLLLGHRRDPAAAVEAIRAWCAWVHAEDKARLEEASKKEGEETSGEKGEENEDKVNSEKTGAKAEGCAVG